MMATQVCVDASLAVKWVVPEEYGDLADLLADECEENQIDFIAPEFVFAEVSNAIRRQVSRQLTPVMNGLAAIATASRIRIMHYTCHDLYTDAWRIAQVHNRPSLYNCYYLALAEQRGCDLWTADEKFFNSVGSDVRVRHIKDFVPGALGG